MTTARQRAYLDAMGIPVWLARGKASAPGESTVAGLVQLGPGDGQVMLLCGSISEPAGQLAADVARALGASPVWAWPVTEDGLAVTDAIGEAMFTHVMVFGAQTERTLFGGPAPELIASAAVLRVPSLEDLAASPEARRSLWSVIKENRLVNGGSPGRKASNA